MRLIKPKVRFVYSSERKEWEVMVDDVWRSMKIKEIQPDRSHSPTYFIVSDRGEHPSKKSFKEACKYAKRYFGG